MKPPDTSGASTAARLGYASLAFYCVSDARYFLGAVAMINSLRLQGHDDPVYLLDCGLEPGQRELLAAEATIVAAPDETAPQLLKTVAPLRHPAEVMVLIDADVIVTRPLAKPIDAARQGSLVAFANNVDRFVAEWGELLDLGTARRRPYACSAFVAMDRAMGDRVLTLMHDRGERVDFERTFWRTDAPGYPFRYADQDVLNAILATRIEPEKVRTLDARLTGLTPFAGLRVVDERSLRCAYDDGVEPYLLHHILPGKPWLRPMPHGIYSRLLKRLLVGDRLAIRVPQRDVPLRLRNGPLAFAERRRSHAAVRLRWELGVVLARLTNWLRGLARRGAAR